MISKILPFILMLITATAYCEKFTVRDEGRFAPSGRVIEFADRYGWENYELKFKFNFNDETKSLGSWSAMNIRINRSDGSHWSYRCTNNGDMKTNVVYRQGLGFYILVECRIPSDVFAKAIGRTEAEVGIPTFVLQLTLHNDEVVVGNHKGLYFVSAGQMERSELREWASSEPDPHNLAIVFRTHREPADNPPD